jgi:hypothetical protein
MAQTSRFDSFGLVCLITATLVHPKLVMRLVDDVDLALTLEVNPVREERVSCDSCEASQRQATAGMENK